MTNSNGWVKVYRSILKKGYYKNSKFVHLWVHLLMRANHEETEILFNGKLEKLQPGEFITGRKQLSVETGISQTSIERILRCFEIEQQIGQQKTNKFRRLTVLNWNQYQKDGQQNGQLADNKRTSGGHLADTDKNIKNERIKEIYTPSDDAKILTGLFLGTLSSEFQSKFKYHEKWNVCFDKLLKEFDVDRLKVLIMFYRRDEFWTKNFMSPLKLLSKNKEGIRYVDYFTERMGSGYMRNNSDFDPNDRLIIGDIKK